MKTHKRVVEVEMSVTETHHHSRPWLWAVEVGGRLIGSEFVADEEAAWAAAVRCAESLGPLATPEVAP